MLTNRETASLILIGAFAVLFVLANRGGVGSLVRAALAPKLLAVWVAYFAYASVVVFLAFSVNLWTLAQLKDAVIITATVGLPLVGKAIKGGDDHFVRDAVKQAVGLSAVLLFYVNLDSFSVLWELLLQTVVVVASIAVALGSRQEGSRARVSVRVGEIAIALVGLAMVAGTTVGVLSRNWTPAQVHEMGLTFAQSIWLPLLLLPFAYVAGLYSSLEGTMLRLRWHNGRVAPPFGVRVATVLGTHGRLRYAQAIKLQWLPRLASAESYRNARDVMSELRSVSNDRF